MKLPYIERLEEGILLFDGAMGTMLYDRGVFINRCFEEVNLSRPEMVERVHRENAEAGAQALTTNSFGANPIKLAGHGLADRTEEINWAAVELARRAAGDELYVAGSVGPLGTRVEPLGQLTAVDARAAYRRQIAALLGAGVDLLLFETFKSLDELRLAVATAREIDREIPIQAQLTIGPYLSGEYRKEAPAIAERLEHAAGIDVIGFNCTIGPSDMLDVLAAVRPLVHRPISIMPNAGFPKDVEGRQIYLTTPEYFAEYAQHFFEGGASVIGGCCGTTPEHIRRMGQAILSFGQAQHRIEATATGESAATMEPVALAERSKLGAALAAGEWISSVEIVPPLGADLSKVIEKTRELSTKAVTCVNVPDGPRASARISAFVAASEIQRASGVEAILHFGCRDRNLIAMQADLLAGEAVGLKNMLLITGDPPKVGNYPDVTGVFDVDSIGLLSLAGRLNRGIDLGGSALAAPTALVLGAGANPVSAALEREIERTHRKAEVGAEFFITQPVFDADALLDFIRRIEDTRVPVIAGVWPLASYRNALFLHNEVPGVVIPEEIMERMRRQETKEDAREEGIRIAREIIERVRGAVRGVQVSPPFGRIQTALDVLG